MGKPIGIALLITAGLAVASVYWSLDHRLQQLEQQTSVLSDLTTRLTSLEQQLPQLKSDVQTDTKQQLHALEIDLINAIKNNSQSDSLLTRQLGSTYQLVTKLVQDLQTLTRQQDDLVRQIEDSRQFASDMVKQLEQDSQRTHRHLAQQFNQQFDNTQQAVHKLIALVEAKTELLKQLIQPGTIIAYSGEPSAEARKQWLAGGWLICDGNRYAVEHYPDLYAVIKNIYGGQVGKTFRVPDLRGVFLRGLDLKRGLDPQRLLGQYQADQNRAHQHEAYSYAAGEHRHTGQYKGAPPQTTELWYSEGTERLIVPNVYVTPPMQRFNTDEQGQHRHKIQIEAEGGRETRPKNQAVVYLIKF